MKHYNHLTENDKKNIFYKEPENFTKDTPRELLSKALGGTLYMPATKDDIAEIIISKKYPSLTSMVLDLEDALDDDNVLEGEQSVYNTFKSLRESIDKGELSNDDIPLVFLRVRNPRQLERLLLKNGTQLTLLTGFVLPKFSTKNADDYLSTVREGNVKYNTKFYALPILETKDIIYKEHRLIELVQLKAIIDNYTDIVLNIRLGGTDFSGLYSIRRSVDTTIYDVMVVRDCISDILNMFNRGEDDYVVSGVVWEFFSSQNRLLKPSLRESPFRDEKGEEGLEERRNLLINAVDGLIKEILLDKTNGIIGKTIIHPTHIQFVNALQTVTEEEYKDAEMIMKNEGKGVLKSISGNKMNEMKPHLYWAKKTLQKAKIYGVLKDGKNYNSLF